MPRTIIIEKELREFLVSDNDTRVILITRDSREILVVV